MTREKLQEQYAGILLQLEVESRAIAENKPNSKIARSARKAIKHAGKMLGVLYTEWRELHRISVTDVLIPELRTYAGYDK